MRALLARWPLKWGTVWSGWGLPADLGGGGSVFGEWKRRIGGRIGDMKHPSLPEYMKIGDLSRAGTQFLGRSHASQAAS